MDTMNLQPIPWALVPITPLPEVTYLEGEDAWAAWGFFMRTWNAQKEGT